MLRSGTPPRSLHHLSRVPSTWDLYPSPTSLARTASNDACGHHAEDLASMQKQSRRWASNPHAPIGVYGLRAKEDERKHTPRPRPHSASSVLCLGMLFFSLYPFLIVLICHHMLRRAAPMCGAYARSSAPSRPLSSTCYLSSTSRTRRRQLKPQTLRRACQEYTGETQG